jgi:hypothetical protein
MAGQSGMISPVSKEVAWSARCCWCWCHWCKLGTAGSAGMSCLAKCPVQIVHLNVIELDNF